MDLGRWKSHLKSDRGTGFPSSPRAICITLIALHCTVSMHPSAHLFLSCQSCLMARRNATDCEASNTTDTDSDTGLSSDRGNSSPSDRDATSRAARPFNSPYTMSSTPLSLPSSSSQQQQQPKKRKRSKIPPRTNRGVDFDRALDENDDVSDTELVAPPLGSRVVDEDYDEEDDEDHEEGDGEGHNEDQSNARGGKGKSRASGKGGSKGSGSREEELGRRNKRIKGEQLWVLMLSSSLVVSSPFHPHEEVPSGSHPSQTPSPLRPYAVLTRRRMLRTLMDADQAKRFDAFSAVVIPKGPITRVSERSVA